MSNAVRGSAGLASPTLQEAQRADMLDHYFSKGDIAMDPKGYFKFKIDTKKKLSFHPIVILVLSMTRVNFFTWKVTD